MKKRIGYSILLLTLLITLGFGFSPALQAQAAANAAPQAEDNTAYVPGQLIVGFAPSVSLGSIASRASEVAQAVGGKVLKTDGQGMALLDVGTRRNLPALELTIKRLKGVRYAEPNYTSQASEPAAGSETGIMAAQVITLAQPPLSSTYPNDPGLLLNAGWQAVSADIVWNNTIPSKTVCLLDSGVDYLHKDLLGKIIKGPDFISGDNDPMDDIGQGTHLAGIIAAIPNNNEGIAGVSTGKVLAVKVIDSSGESTAYDLALGINYCADQASVSILLIGWGTTKSDTLYNAIYHAVHDKGKLVVAAAGNNSNTDMTYSYPAAYSVNFPDQVVAVTSSGKANGSLVDYSCMEVNDTYGSWITLAAPGHGIYSTVPWDKPFSYSTFQTEHYAVSQWYGTNAAAAFVAGAAARVWGYMPAASAVGVVGQLRNTGNAINPGCWPGMPGTLKLVNLAKAMDRGAALIYVFDALTALPIPGARVTVYNSTTNAVLASGVVPSRPATELVYNIAYHDPFFAEVVNLPAGALSTQMVAKVSAANYTASPQNAFLVLGSTSSNADGKFTVDAGTYRFGIMAFVPPKSANFAVVGQTAYSNTPRYLAAWVPSQTPPGPNKFIVANQSYADPPAPPVMPHGSMYTDPYARWMKQDTVDYEALLIRSRTSDAAAPWYKGTYWVGLSDGLLSGANQLDNLNVSVLVWKDGVIKARVDKGANLCGASAHWWYPLQIISPASGAATYIRTPAHCGTINDAPYFPSP